MLTPHRGDRRWRSVVLLVLAGLLATMAHLIGGAPATAVETRSPVFGTVRLSTGDPAAGSVTVYRLDPTPDAGYDFYTGESIEGGQFDVDLDPGTYKFLFRSWAGNSSRWYATGSATGADLENATPVTVAGSPRELALTTIPVRVVSVVAKDELGNPLSDVEIEGSYATDPGDPGYEERCDWWNWASTGSDGTGVFIAPMNCALTFDGRDDDGTHEAGHVTVSAGTAPASVVMQMPRRATISGTVTAAAGGALDRVLVTAYDEFGEARAETETDDAGSFTLLGLPADSYTLRFDDHLGDFTGEYYDNAAELAGATYFPVAANADVTGKNASLAAALTSTADRDLTGVVHGTDGPLPAVRVTAYRNGIEKASTLSGRDGRYEFASLTAGSYQLQYERLSGWSSELPYSPQWYLNSRSSGSSTPVSVTPDAAGADRDVTLQQWGAISGHLTNDAGTAVENPYFGALDVDMYDSEPRVMDSEPGTYTLALPPGKHHVSYGGVTDDGDTSYIQEFWKDSSSIIGSTPVVVVGGVVKSGFDVQLTTQLQNKTVPKITGTPVVGKTLSASTGTWNLMADNQYKVEWLRGSTPVAIGTLYKLTAADAGKKLTARVTATHVDRNGDLTGTALSAATATVKRPSVTSFTGTSPASRKVRLVIAVTGTGLTNPGGTVAIKRGTRTIRSGVAVVNGRVTVTLTSQPAGSQRYQVVYSGTAVVRASTSVVRTITVRR
ncbi:carboxypeptidase regulatory-like domain-containing protein [Nocardioides sp. WS12]|uniref:carboxypeptidase regulatory-like domain-containing protein n=1 Tax=Nocardioides sp. WS12 TaxID=2486272 RepID=UPI0015FB8124|nr:carboxypeptidase regulatory-like domain-containing protein [Nocardioides sp. WS12]